MPDGHAPGNSECPSCSSPLFFPAAGICRASAEPTVLAPPTTESDPIWNLRSHHCPSIQLAPVHDEGAITDCVNGSRLFS